MERQENPKYPIRGVSRQNFMRSLTSNPINSATTKWSPLPILYRRRRLSSMRRDDTYTQSFSSMVSEKTATSGVL